MPVPPSSADLPLPTAWDRRLGPVMFWVTIVWLAVLGVLVHVIADERVLQLEGPPGFGLRLKAACEWILLLLFPLFAIEGLIHRAAGGSQLRQNVLFALLPPARVGSRDHAAGAYIWLPGGGWQRANDDLAEELERKLGVPMIVVALLILPLLAFEHLWESTIKAHPPLALAVQLAGALIWMAFAVEFIVMLSLVKKKAKFIKSHWLDLAIICLPLIYFLRTLRIARLARVAKVSKTARVFRLRGLLMRAWRALLLLEVIDRVLHRDPHKRLRMIHEQIAEKELELAELRDEARRLEAALPPPQTAAVEAPLDAARS